MGSNIRDAALSILDAFNKVSPTAAVRDRADSCVHTIAPASVGSNIGSMNNTVLAEHVSTFANVLNTFAFTPNEVWVNESSSQVFIWATSKPEFKKEAKGKNPVESEWHYEGEFIFVMDFNEEGKAVRVIEFLDSLTVGQLMGMVARAHENMGLEVPSWLRAAV